jgi:septal ring factor EnvC (AmiA/AmiB activator)
MDEIEAFRNRIGQSLAVIAEGIERLGQDVPAAPAPQADTAELVALRAMLEDERVVQAQLEERVRSLRERLERGTAEAESAAAAAQAEMAAMDQALQGLRQTTADLREVVGQLRAALAEEVAEPALVNRAMLAEIEALRAERAADLAEVHAVYGALRPLVREAM